MDDQALHGEQGAREDRAPSGGAAAHARPPVCLIRPRAGEAFRFSAQSISLPLGLAYIAAALEHAAQSVHVVDAVGAAPDRHTRYFRGYLIGLDDAGVAARIPPAARIVGISVIFTHEWPAAVLLVTAIRRARPELTIVLGGEHATACPEFCLATAPADVIVLGEGEQTMVELVDALQRGRPLTSVTGIAFRDGDQVHVNPRRPRRADVDSIPRPAWQHFDVAGYHARRFVGGVYNRRITLPILATRGCPYQCTYCTNPNMWTTAWVPRDPLAVVDEIEHGMATYGARNFPFQDLTAVLRKDWIVAFCKEVIARGLDIRWQMPTGTRSESVDREVAELLRRSGMVGMAYAPESGADGTRELIKKRMGGDSLLGSVQAAAEAGLNVAVFVVLGFPHDTQDDLRENLAFMDRLAAAGATELSTGYYMNLPGTQLFDSQYDAGRIVLDRGYFGHILQNTELYPSRSYCESMGRARLTLWSLRLYARFFRANARYTRRRRQASTIRRGVTGMWDDHDTAKLPDALRHAARSLFRTWRSMLLGPRWTSRRAERELIADWDALYRGIREQQLSAGVPQPPLDSRALHDWNATAATRETHGTARAVRTPRPAHAADPV